MWWCPQLHVDRHGYTNLRRRQLCQTPGGIYLIVTMEDTMKKKRVWDAGRVFALAEYIVLYMSWIEIFRNFFPIPNGTHILSAPISLNNDIPYTMMPVSFAIISMRLYPAILHSLHVTSLAYRIPHVYMASADIRTHQRLAQDSPYICIQSWYYIIFPSQNTVWAMATGR